MKEKIKVVKSLLRITNTFFKKNGSVNIAMQVKSDFKILGPVLETLGGQGWVFLLKIVKSRSLIRLYVCDHSCHSRVFIHFDIFVFKNLI